MTAAAMSLRGKLPRPGRSGSTRVRERRGEPRQVPPLTPRLQVIRASLVMVVVLTVAMLLHLTFISGLQHRAAQQRAYADFRAQLARGTAPLGATDAEGDALELGAPVAYLEIRAIGLQEVVGEGTTGPVLMDGPGHRRDTPLPGQVGTTVIMARRAAYGAPFGDIAQLTAGDQIKVATGQGLFTYTVTGVRHEGDPVPDPPTAGAGRLTLMTAAGPAFFPSGVVRVDAELEEPAVGGPARTMGAAGLPDAERAMGGSTDTVWALALWMQALLALAAAAVWAWYRWGRAQTWVVFLPPLVLVGISLSSEIVKLLPNLL